MLGNDRTWGLAAFLDDYAVFHVDSIRPSLSSLQLLSACERDSEKAAIQSASIVALCGRKRRRGGSNKGKKGSSHTGKPAAKRPALGALSGSVESEEAPKPKFSISEFTRLILVLKVDEEGREAFKKFGQTLERLQLDAGQRLDNLWCSVIARRFNDDTFRPSYNLDTLYPVIDPTRPPPAPRHGSFLKKNFDYFRKSSILPFDRFNSSGQNNCDFKLFYEWGGNNSDSVVGMRVVIEAAIIRLGTSNEDVFFLNRTSRRMSVTENIGCEGGMGAEVEAESGSFHALERSGARRTSRRTSADHQKKFRDNTIHFQTKAIDYMDAQTKSFVSSQSPNDMTSTLKEQQTLLSM